MPDLRTAGWWDWTRRELRVMNHPVLEILLVLLLLLLNGIFAMTEIAIVSSRRGILQALAEKGSRGAVHALELADNPNRFLSTVQIVITLVGILAGAFGGARLVHALSPQVALLPWVGRTPKRFPLPL